MENQKFDAILNSAFDLISKAAGNDPNDILLIASALTAKVFTYFIIVHNRDKEEMLRAFSDILEYSIKSYETHTRH